MQGGGKNGFKVLEGGKSQREDAGSQQRILENKPLMQSSIRENDPFKLHGKGLDSKDADELKDHLYFFMQLRDGKKAARYLGKIRKIAMQARLAPEIRARAVEVLANLKDHKFWNHASKLLKKEDNNTPMFNALTRFFEAVSSEVQKEIGIKGAGQ